MKYNEDGFIHNYHSGTLYKVTSSGSLRQWTSWSEGNVVYTKFGKVGGKLQISRDVILNGKNIGKVNGTTPESQANLEAKHLRDAQIKRGYLEDRGAAENTDNALPAILPMLAHKYADMKSPGYPAFSQPKLDGIRCIAIVKNRKALLYTRSQKLIDTVPHINKAIEDLCEKRGLRLIIFDGELYNHELHDDFNRILGAIKRKGIGKDSLLVHYYIYDLPSEDTFKIRTESLMNLLSGISLPLETVETTIIRSEDELHSYAKKCVKNGYEGCMYRSYHGLYENKRSKNLLKFKTMKDEEFKVIGYQQGSGKLMGKVGSFICITNKKVEFRAKLEGKLDDLPDFNSAKANALIGKTLTVRFQDYTPDGAPRFPVGVKFKDPIEC